MLADIKNEVEVSGLFDFVKKFKLTKYFMEKYRLKKLEDFWDDFVDKDGFCRSRWTSDEEAIEELLDEMKGKYLVVYEDTGNGYFRIFEVE